MRFKIVNGVDIKDFKEKLKLNKNTCICSLDYDNLDMKCMCKDFKESDIGTICHCGIFKKI